MSVTKATSQTSVRDQTTGLTANVRTRVDGKNALIVDTLGNENITTSGSLTALNSTITTTDLSAISTIGFTITGTWVGTISFQGSIDSVNWFSINALKIGGIISNSTTSNGQFKVSASGLAGFRLIMSSYTSGSASIVMVSSSGVNNRGQNFIIGGTDATIIGNEADRLKVATQPSSATTTVPSWSKFLRYDDMNVSTGGIARGTSIPNSASWTTVYSYTGSGYVGGAVYNVETFATGWEFRLNIDGQTIFSLLDTDLAGDAIYDVDDVSDVNQAFIGISKGSHDRFLWHAPMSSPVYYASSVQAQIRRQAGAKKFQAGLMVLSRET